ncbi:redoxin domain-containing protein [Solwaraspora sp. WMMD406]|uniref:redoxin domain-containing protein n=1 Tax=Solwaraspora sp. WMMD406 TaxID=3016095 RepID=UPI002417C339|nr:redoxin domain-containing protein [Solwaraspora sp. WMMD406]MDG4766321.1 redoxin domain-containing protein [Solwaraspora sp. WMMD406]
MWRDRIIAVALVAVVLVVTGCGPGPSAADRPVSAGSTAPGHVDARPSAAEVPDPLPAYLTFTAPTLDDATFDGRSLAGRPAVLWFWAPWCAMCAGQASSVASVADEYGGRLSVVGVAGLGEEAAMRDFVEEFDLYGFPHLRDTDGAVWREFEITEQSWYVFLDADGTMVHRGWLDSLQFDQQVAELAR